MALGRKIITWNADEIVKGVSTSDDISDAGFSPNTDAVNLIASPGVCYQPAAPTDKSTDANGQMIASCEDPTQSYARIFVSQDTDLDGRFFSSNSEGTLTARGSEDTGANYIQGSCDAIAYKNEVYITNSAYVVRWSDVGGANTFNTTFHSFTNVSVPHPAIVYEDNAYYGDGNVLKRQTAAGGVPAAVLTLPAGQVIVTLGVDPGSGKMLVSVVGQQNISDTVNSSARVLYYDGFSNKALKVVLVDQMITAFPTSAGGLYAAYGNNLGYWNGSGVSFLRNFSNIGYDNAQLLYKQHFTNIGSTLYFVVRNRIFAHGPIVQGGAHVFYPAFYNAPAGVVTEITHVANLGSGILAYAYATSKFYTWSTTSVASTSTQSLYSNEYELEDFNEGVWLRRVKIFWKNQVSNNVDPGSIRFLNENGLVTTLGTSGTFDLTNSTGAATGVTEIPVGGGTATKFNQIQFNILLDTVNTGIRRVEIYADPANKP